MLATIDVSLSDGSRYPAPRPLSSGRESGCQVGGVEREAGVVRMDTVDEVLGPVRHKGEPVDQVHVRIGSHPLLRATRIEPAIRPRSTGAGL